MTDQSSPIQKPTDPVSSGEPLPASETSRLCTLWRTVTNRGAIVGVIIGGLAAGAMLLLEDGALKAAAIAIGTDVMGGSETTTAILGIGLALAFFDRAAHREGAEPSGLVSLFDECVRGSSAVAIAAFLTLSLFALTAIWVSPEAKIEPRLLALMSWILLCLFCTSLAIKEVMRLKPKDRVERIICAFAGALLIASLFWQLSIPTDEQQPLVCEECKCP